MEQIIDQEDKNKDEKVASTKPSQHEQVNQVKSKRINPDLNKPEDQVTCSVCFRCYTDLKVLQCLHTYCQQCLQGLVQQDQQGKLTLTCPTCCQVTPAPASGVANLQADFRANQLLEIADEGEEWKEGAAVKRPRLARPEDESHSRSTSVFCLHHFETDLEFYCENCEQTICWKCATAGGNHYGHNYRVLNEVCQVIVPSSLANAEEVKEMIKMALAQFNACCEEISSQRADIEKEVHSTDLVDVRKKELISQLHQLTEAKLKSLAAQRNQIETIQGQLNRHLHSIRETSNQPEATLRKNTAVKQVEELTTSFQPGMLKPNTEADMKFYATISDGSHTSGIIASSLPFKCHYTKMIAVGAKSTALFETVDSHNQPLEISMDSITCELVSELTGTRVEASIERKGQIQYQISYQPTIKGRHQLHIKVEGQQIRGSPFPVDVSLVEVVGTPIPILTIGGVDRPYGIAINQKGEVVVAEYYGHCVTVFSSSGERLRSFGTLGSDLGQFKSPDGVAVDWEENILVADTGNHRIQKFSAQGKFLQAVGTKGTGTLQFNCPRGIAFNNNNGRVYIVDSWNDRIQILSSDLSYLDIFGERGSGMGQFILPQHITCDSTGNVHVADINNHRIQVFTAKGKFLRMFGSCGENRGELKEPYGIAIDSSDRVYVSEWGNHRVSVFTSDGQFVSSFYNEEGEGSGQFRYPSGIAVDSSGVVYVCDSWNQRVEVVAMFI